MQNVTQSQAKASLVDAHASSVLGLEDLDRIIDLYYYEAVPKGSSGPLACGAGAYCYYGVPTLTKLGGTELEPWVDRLARHIKEHHPQGEDFRVEFDGGAWRACRDTSDVGTQLSIRRLPSTTPKLEDLRLTESMVRNVLTSSWLNDGGLVVFAGLTGQGKTTLAAATVRTRLEAFGGRAVSVEDVREHPLEGVWEKGSCRQIQVTYGEGQGHGFAGAVRRAYRSLPATRPAVLFIGEVRDTETAVEVVKAAANGMLVITTIHAFDAITAVQRIASLAGAGMGEAATSALSHALRLVVHQSLDLSPTVMGWRRGVFKQSLLVSDGAAHQVANNIRRGEYSQISQVERFQQVRMANASRRGSTAADFLKEVGSIGSS